MGIEEHCHDQKSCGRERPLSNGRMNDCADLMVLPAEPVTCLLSNGVIFKNSKPFSVSVRFAFRNQVTSINCFKVGHAICLLSSTDSQQINAFKSPLSCCVCHLKKVLLMRTVSLFGYSIAIKYFHMRRIEISKLKSLKNFCFKVKKCINSPVRFFNLSISYEYFQTWTFCHFKTSVETSILWQKDQLQKTCLYKCKIHCKNGWREMGVNFRNFFQLKGL